MISALTLNKFPYRNFCAVDHGICRMCANGNLIGSVADLGALVRQERNRRDVTQADFAMLVGVGRRFIIDLERGKPTLEAGKLLHVLLEVGFVVKVVRE